MAWTSPRTWVAGETPTAATFNLHIRDNFKAIGDAWTAYTPTWTATTTDPVIGNGTINGKYMAAGKLIHARIVIVAGSTTTFGTGGGYRFGLPVATHADITSWTPIGQAILQDVSASARYAYTVMGVTSGAQVAAVIDDAGAQIGETTPFTFANTDVIRLDVCYEAV